MSSEMYTEMIMQQLDHIAIKEHIGRFGYYSIQAGSLRIDLRWNDYTVHYVSELSLMMVDSRLPRNEWVDLFLQPLARKPFINAVSFFEEKTGFEYPAAFSLDCEWVRKDWFASRENMKVFIDTRITQVVPMLRQMIENRLAAKHQYDQWKTQFYSKYDRGSNS